MGQITKPTAFARVVVTRPKAQCESWIKRIVESKHEALVVSSLDIIPVSSGQGVQAIKNHVTQLDNYNVLIFVSQNAVSHAFEWIENFWPQLPEQLTWLAIGKKTHELMSDRLNSLGLAVASDYPQQMTSEALLKSPQLKAIEQRRVLIFRGVGGRSKLHDVLQERGALVEHCELYERKMPENALTVLKQREISPETDVLTFFSGETLTNFYKLLQQSTIKNWKDFCLLVPSKRVHDLARSYGFHHLIQAENASESVMWDALKPFLSER